MGSGWPTSKKGINITHHFKYINHSMSLKYFLYLIKKVVIISNEKGIIIGIISITYNKFIYRVP